MSAAIHWKCTRRYINSSFLSDEPAAQGHRKDRTALLGGRVQRGIVLLAGVVLAGRARVHRRVVRRGRDLTAVCRVCLDFFVPV